MGEVLDMIWQNPLYRLLAIIIVGEALFFLTLSGGVLAQLFQQTRHQSRRDEFAETLGEELTEILGDSRAQKEWIERATAYESEIVRDFLIERLVESTGERQHQIADLYRRLGFVDQDRRELQAPNWEVRLMAMRRLYFVARPEDRDAIIASSDDLLMTRMLAARALIRIGRAEDLVEMLGDLELQSRLMEEPLLTVFEELTREQFRTVFTHFDAFDDPRMRRILLMRAATYRMPEALPILDEAVRGYDLELRIGACAAAGMYEDEKTLSYLLELLDDPAWEVRARAATALGERGAPEAIELLADALRDEAFWVRQNAANALRAFRQPGIERLQRVVDEAEDPFAVDTASQELQRHRLQSEMQGVSA